MIYTDETIRYDLLGYELINERALNDLRTLYIVIVALIALAYNTVKPIVIDAFNRLCDKVEEEINSFDEEALKEAVQDLYKEPAERIGYMLTTLRTYYIQLVTKPIEEGWEAFEDLM